MAKKRTKRGGRAGATGAAQRKSEPQSTTRSSANAPRFSMLNLSAPFESGPPPASETAAKEEAQPPASSPALERASDAYGYRVGEEEGVPLSQRVTLPASLVSASQRLTRPAPTNSPTDKNAAPIDPSAAQMNVDNVHIRSSASTTMLPPPLPLEDATTEEPTSPLSHERVKAAEPLAEDERPSDGTLDRLAEAYTPSFFETEEQRSSPRIALEVELHVASDSHFFTGLSGDISEGGVFVSTYRKLAIGSEVDLEFTLPTSWQRVRARGRIRWHREASAGVPPGVGIAFEVVDDVDRAAIERFCTTHPPLYYDDVG